MKLSQERFDSIVGNTGLGVAGRFVGRFLIAIESILIARMLGPNAFGLYAIGLTMFRLLEIITPLGFDIGVVRFGSQNLASGNYQSVKRIISGSIIVSFVFSMMIGFLIFVFSPWIANIIYHKNELVIVFRLFCVLIPLSGLLAVIAAASRIDSKLKYSVIAQDLSQPLLAILFLIIFWFAGLRLEFIIVADQISYLGAVIIAALFLSKVSKALFTNSDFKLYSEKDYYSFSFIAASSVFLSTLVFWVDRLFAGFYLSASEVGIYQAGLQLSALVAVVLGAFGKSILPVFSSLHSEGKIQELQEVFRIGTKWILYLGMPFILFFCLNSRNLLIILYGENYSQGNMALLILLAGQAINLATGSVGPLLLVGGYQRCALILSCISLFVNAVLSMILIPRYGIPGAALANAISTMFLYTLLLISVRKKMKLWPYDFHYLKGFISIFVTAVVILLFRQLFSYFILVNLLIEILVSILVFFSLLFAMGLTHEDRMFLTLILKRLGYFRPI